MPGLRVLPVPRTGAMLAVLEPPEVGRIGRAPIVITVDREQRAARVGQADDAALVVGKQVPAVSGADGTDGVGSVPRFPQHQIERACAAMAGVGIADGGDAAGVAAVGEPGFEFAADGAARCLIRPALLARDQQDDARALPRRAIERAGKVGVRAGETVAVQIDDQIGFEPAGPDTAIPCAVERGGDAPRLGRDLRRGWSRRGSPDLRGRFNRIGCRWRDCARRRRCRSGRKWWTNAVLARPPLERFDRRLDAPPIGLAGIGRRLCHRFSGRRSAG